MVKCAAAVVVAVMAVCAGIAYSGEDSERYRVFRIGDIELVALVDRPTSSRSSPDILIGLTPEELAAYPDGFMTNSINAFLVRLDGKNLLFDTGFGGDQGGVAESLAAYGVQPGDIDAVIITHFHGDHVGGLLDKGKPVFENAELRLPRVEVDNWDERGLGFIPAYGVQASVFEFGREAWPGVTAIDARGHTPGHTAFRIQSGGERLMIVSDLIHFPEVQMARPDVAVRYDTDPVQAVAARKRVFDMAAADGDTVAAMHIAFPGVGKLAKSGTGYTFTPAR